MRCHYGDEFNRNYISQQCPTRFKNFSLQKQSILTNVRVVLLLFFLLLFNAQIRPKHKNSNKHLAINVRMARCLLVLVFWHYLSISWFSTLISVVCCSVLNGHAWRVSFNVEPWVTSLQLPVVGTVLDLSIRFTLYIQLHSPVGTYSIVIYL